MEWTEILNTGITHHGKYGQRWSKIKYRLITIGFDISCILKILGCTCACCRINNIACETTSFFFFEIPKTRKFYKSGFTVKFKLKSKKIFKFVFIFNILLTPSLREYKRFSWTP